LRTLIDQIEGSLASGFYYLSLFAALAVPDIAGALDSENGKASGQKYIDWYEKWVRPRFAENTLAAIPEQVRPYIQDLGVSPFSGEACYRFRCSLLHQGSAQHPRSPFTRILFIEPDTTTNVVHYTEINDALAIDLRLFCREVTSGAIRWLDTAESSPRYIQNYERFARRHPMGLAPYIGGVPVVG